MDVPGVIRLPVSFAVPEETIFDLVAAIELVASGAARRVVLSGIPGVEAVAAEALACAQAAGVGFRLLRSSQAPPAVIVGPVEA